MRRILLLPFAAYAITSIVAASEHSPEQNPALLKIAILPFENRTPNPNIDWISALFVDSYKAALQKRFRIEFAPETLVQKSLDLLQDYRVSGKARFQVFAAMTGADVVLGGFFLPASDQALSIQSEIFFTRSNRFEKLERVQTPVESATLFASVDRSAAESVTTIAKNSRVINSTGLPVLSVPYLPRVAITMPDAKGSTAEMRALRRWIEAEIVANETFELQIDADAPLPANTDERQAYFNRHGLAYAIASEWQGGRFVLKLYSPHKGEVLASFTGVQSTREKSASDALRQMMQFVRGMKFRPRVEVTGLKGKDLQLELSGIKKRETSSNGELQFEQELPLGADYVMTLGAEPNSPAQRCFILNATGRVTITGTNHVTVVCITQRYTIEGSVEGLTGGEVVLQVNDTESVRLRENAPFRIPDTFEDFEPLRLNIRSRPTDPAQQCDFVSPPARVMGKTTRLRLYCMPLLQHWITVSGNYPIMQSSSARPNELRPNASFPLNAVSGRFGLTAGYWARYYLRHNILLGGEASYSYMQGTADLFSGNGTFVESAHTLYYHAIGINGLVGYEYAPKWKFAEHTRIVPFAGLGPRYVSLRSSASIALLSTFGPGVIAGFNWYYAFGDSFQAGIRYHADLTYIVDEPIILQHHVGLQMGAKLW